MKIITRYNSKTEDVIDTYTYCIYLMQDNNHPLQVYIANNEREKNLICEQLLSTYTISTVSHIKKFNIDLSDTLEYN